jgi:hypothetical protein
MPQPTPLPIRPTGPYKELPMKKYFMRQLLWVFERLYNNSIISVETACSFTRWYEKEYDKPLFCGMSQKGQWWFRVFGVGLSWKDIRIHKLTFSERNGYRKGLRIGSWLFHFLPSISVTQKEPVDLPEWYRMAEGFFNEIKVFSTEMYDEMNGESILTQLRYAAEREVRNEK